MQAITYTGTGATQTITVGFQPDFVWIKSRSAATDHKLVDSIRGSTKAISSDTTNAESTDSNGITAFTSTGFTLGSDSTYNNSGVTYVAWCWLAGGTAVTNTNGSITSTVSVNTTAGFSVVSFTGLDTSGTAATMGHGLGVAPSFIIIKNRDYVDGWYCYHASLGNTAYIVLNTTAAQQTPSNVWSSTSPTSTVFTLRQGNLNTTTAQKLIAYCFAAIPGYSAFGSYTGNGSTSGPFVYTGLRPRFILIKRSDATSDWGMIDTSRGTYNSITNYLLADNSSAELTDNQFDILSNGFKCRTPGGNLTNTSGGTYIYAAFAENPFKYSLAR